MDSQNRKWLQIPEEVNERLLSLANELDFGHQGKVCVMPLIDALSQIEPETLYEVLRQERLLPKKEGKYI